jgi:hypothetical protein
VQNRQTAIRVRPSPGGYLDEGNVVLGEILRTWTIESMIEKVCRVIYYFFRKVKEAILARSLSCSSVAILLIKRYYDGEIKGRFPLLRAKNRAIFD